VWPCHLFVRLWYRVSDVLDLSLVSKRFGFWPHITHVIVLTFKEIKHLADYRTVGLSDCGTVGLSDCRTIGLSDYRSDHGNNMNNTWNKTIDRVQIPVGNYIVILQLLILLYMLYVSYLYVLQGSRFGHIKIFLYTTDTGLHLKSK
jgi:hypothetical protein